MTFLWRRRSLIAAGAGALVLYLGVSAFILVEIRSDWHVLAYAAQVGAVLLLGSLLVRQLAVQRRTQAALTAANTNLQDAQASLGTSNNALRFTKEELKRARQQLIDGIEGLTDGLALYDADDRLVVCNSRYRELFGLGPDLLRPGTPFQDILRAHVKGGRVAAAVGREDEWVTERLAQHRDSQGFFERLIDGHWYRFSDRPTSTGGTVTIFAQIDELKQREHRLHENQAILQSILDHIPVGVGIADRERRIVLLNKRLEALYGVALADVRGRSVAEVRPSRYSQDSAAEDHLRVIETGEPILGREDHYPHEAGEESWITSVVPIKDEQGRVKYVLRTTMEVPQLARANRELADYRAFLIEAERQAKIASCYQPVGRDDGMVWSENVQDVLGVPPERLGRDADLLALIHPDDRQRMADLFREITDHPRSYDTEYRVVRPDGCVAWIRGLAKMQREAAGTPARLIGAVQDITGQKRIEEALRESETRLKDAQRRARLAYWIWDMDAQCYNMSEGCTEILGVPWQDLKTPGDFHPYIHDDDREWVGAFYRRQREVLEPNTIEYRWRRPDGKVIWLRDVSGPETGADGRVRRISGSIQDVSEQKWIEEVLRENQALLLAAQRRARIAYWLADVDSDGAYVASDLMAEVLGLSPDAVPTNDADCLKLVHPEDRARVAHAYERAMIGRTAYAIEYRMFRGDGSMGWVRELSEIQDDAAGRPSRMIGTVQDITEQKATEEALRDSEELLREVVMVSEIGIFDHDHRVDAIFWSPEQRKHYGFGVDEEVTLPGLLECVHPEDRDWIIAAVKRAHDPRGNGRFDVEHRIVRRDGAIRWLDTRSQTFFEGEGDARRPVRTVGAVVDITARKNGELALKDSESRLRRAQLQAKLACWTWNLETDSYVWAPGSGLALGLPDSDLPAADAGYGAIVHPEDRDALWRIYAEVAAGRDAFTAEFRLMRPDGEAIWVEEIGEVERDAGGRRVSVSGTLQDVTERKRADAALRDGEARLRGFLDHAPFAMYLKDTDLRYLLVNRAVEQFQGMTAAEICGRTPDQIYPPPLAERFIAEDREVLERRVPVTFEYNDPTLSSYADSLTVRFPIFDADGRIVAIGGITQDITERKHAERALRESEGRMRSFMDNAPVAMAVKDLERRFVMANRHVVGPYGRTVEDVIGKRTIDIANSEGAKTIDALEREVIAGGQTVTAEVHFAERSVSPWTFEVKFPIRDANGNLSAIGGIAIDTTATKRQERALRASEARMRSFMDNAPVAVAIKDLERRFILLNGKIERAYGRPAAEIIGRRTIDLSESEGAAAVDALEQEVIATGNVATAEVHFPDRTALPWTFEVKFPIRDAAGEIVAIGGVAVDISDRKKAQMALAESEARLRRAQQQARLAYWSWQFGTDRVAEEFRWSPGSGPLLGVADDGMPVVPGDSEKMMHPDDLARVRRLYDEVRAGLDQYTAEYRVLRPDGQVVWVREIGEAVRDADGRRVGVEGTLQDITEQHALEEQLIQSQKMEAIGQLTGGIAHDFNNLLAVILGNLELLGEELSGDAGIRQKIDAALRSTLRGSDLTHRLLAYARRQPLAPRVTQINELIRNMRDLVLRPLGPTIDVTFALGEKLWPTEIDQAQLETSLLNLVINARDAMPDGGRLVIETANVTIGPDNPRRDDALAPGDYVCIAVGDSGTGMSETVKARAFDPFFTTKGVGKGTGLGLSMVYGFVKQSGGHVEIDSTIGSGTTIRILLPRAKNSTVAAAAA